MITGPGVTLVQEEVDPVVDPTMLALSSGMAASDALRWAMASCLCIALGTGGGALRGAAFGGAALEGVSWEVDMAPQWIPGPDKKLEQDTKLKMMGTTGAC